MKYVFIGEVCTGELPMQGMAIKIEVPFDAMCDEVAQMIAGPEIARANLIYSDECFRVFREPVVES